MEKQETAVLLQGAQDVDVSMNRASSLMRYRYILHLIENGHIPGVLTEAERHDLSAEERAHYARCRKRAAELVSPFGVRAGAAKIDGRWTVVWTDAAGNRVRVRISST